LRRNGKIFLGGAQQKNHMRHYEGNWEKIQEKRKEVA